MVGEIDEMIIKFWSVLIEQSMTQNLILILYKAHVPVGALPIQQATRR